MPGHGVLTIKKIAALAGVSRGTVDRVLNQRPGVSPTVRAQILDLAQRSGFRAHPAARALGLAQRPLTLGLVLPPPSLRFFEGVRAGARQARDELAIYGVRLEERSAASSDPGAYAEAVRSLVGAGVRGLAVTGPQHGALNAAVDEAVAEGVPVVTYNSDLPESRRSCFVGQDLEASGQLAAGLMARVLAPGTPVLVVVGSLGFQAMEARLHGFARGWPGAELVVVEGREDPDLTRQGLRSALKLHPRIGGVYLAAAPLQACLQELASRSGPRLRVIANDRLPEVRQGLASGLIDFTILQSEDQQGARPVRLLYEALRGGNPLPSGPQYVKSSIRIAANVEED